MQSDQMMSYITGQRRDALSRQRQRLAADDGPDRTIDRAMATARGWPPPPVETRAHPARERLMNQAPQAEVLYMPVVDEVLGAYRMVPSIARLSRLYQLAPATVGAIIEAGRDLEDAHCYPGHMLGLGDLAAAQALEGDAPAAAPTSSYRRESRAVRDVLANWERRCRALSPQDIDRLEAGMHAWRDACLGHRGAWIYSRPAPLMAFLGLMQVLGLSSKDCLEARVSGKFPIATVTSTFPLTLGRTGAAIGSGRSECELRVSPCGTPGLSYPARFSRCLMAARVWCHAAEPKGVKTGGD